LIGVHPTQSPSGNQVGDEGAARLGEALQRNTRLKSLFLSSTGGREGEGDNPSELKILDRTRKKPTPPSCADNQVGAKGAARLGEAFQLNTSITTLDLGGTKEGMESIGRMDAWGAFGIEPKLC